MISWLASLAGRVLGAMVSKAVVLSVDPVSTPRQFQFCKMPCFLILLCCLCGWLDFQFCGSNLGRFSLDPCRRSSSCVPLSAAAVALSHTTSNSSYNVESSISSPVNQVTKRETSPCQETCSIHDGYFVLLGRCEVSRKAFYLQDRLYDNVSDTTTSTLSGSSKARQLQEVVLEELEATENMIELLQLRLNHLRKLRYNFVAKSGVHSVPLDQSIGAHLKRLERLDSHCWSTQSRDSEGCQVTTDNLVLRTTFDMGSLPVADYVGYLNLGPIDKHITVVSASGSSTVPAGQVIVSVSGMCRSLSPRRSSDPSYIKLWNPLKGELLWVGKTSHSACLESVTVLSKLEDQLILTVDMFGGVRIHSVRGTKILRPLPNRNKSTDRQGTSSESRHSFATHRLSVELSSQWQYDRPEPASSCKMYDEHSCKQTVVSDMELVGKCRRTEFDMEPSVMSTVMINYRGYKLTLFSDAWNGISVYKSKDGVFRGRCQTSRLYDTHNRLPVLGIVPIASTSSGHLLFYTKRSFGQFNPLTVDAVGPLCDIGTNAAISAAAVDTARPHRVALLLSDGQLLLYENRQSDTSCQLVGQAMVESSAPVDVAFVKGFIVVLSNCDATFPMPPLYQQMSRHGGRNATTNCCNVVVLNATAMIAGNNRQDVVVSTQRLNFTVSGAF
eukprot:GHVQ01023225.1.p1 GENE.GHVQ01023225.1~~GHVQ01023225.1.p1  ORF type:complete len:669 (+),score=35.49 GHVQ01023225.1:81-2087(+)